MQPDTQHIALNRAIEALLMPGAVLEIEEQFGMSALSNYLSEVALIAAGVPFAELGFSERRASLLPRLLPFSAAGDVGQLVAVQNLEKQNVPANSIALLKLNGVMRSQDGLSSYGADTFSNWLRSAYSNPNVAGIVIESESGGGEAMAGTKIENALSERNKPVVAYAHMAASAAYRAVSSADEIIGAGPASQFGSIGVMYEIDKKKLSEIKERYEVILSDHNPKKIAEQRNAINGDYSGLKDAANKMAAEFHAQIKKSRPLTGDIKETLSGAMFGAMEAKQRGLIDMVGNLQTAVRRVHALKSKYK